MYTRYFHDESSKPRDVTRALPTTMRMAPTLTSVTNFPHLDMITPAIRPPIGVAKDGIASRAPAVVAESSRTIWKKRGRLKRYCKGVSAYLTRMGWSYTRVLTAYADKPTQMLEN